MVAAVRYFGAPEDHAALLDYLGEPAEASLHPWPVVRSPLEHLSRAEALAREHVIVTHAMFGPAVAIRPGDRAMREPTKAGFLNRLNWSRSRPLSGEGLLDSNVSPVLFWRPGRGADDALHVSEIGSQADAMSVIGDDYEKWVKRVLGWVRRKGTKVWGEERGQTRPDLDIELSFVSAVYALPTALAALERGTPGRW